MAEQAVRVESIQRGVYKATWEGIGTGGGTDTGAALDVPGGFADVTIQVKGTFAGSTLTWEGSNDGGTTWAGVNDSRGEGNALTFTAADLKTLNELPAKIRPVLTSGSGTDLDAIVIVRKRKG